MGSMSNRPTDNWQDIDSEWGDQDDDATPVKDPPALEADREQSPAPAAEEPEAAFEEDADTIFEGDEPTADYLENEIPDHVAEFLDEGKIAPPEAEVIVPLPAPAGQQEPAVAKPDVAEPDVAEPAVDALLDQLPTNASLTLVILMIGLLLSIAGVVYVALYHY